MLSIRRITRIFWATRTKKMGAVPKISWTPPLSLAPYAKMEHLCRYLVAWATGYQTRQEAYFHRSPWGRCP